MFTYLSLINKNVYGGKMNTDHERLVSKNRKKVIESLCVMNAEIQTATVELRTLVVSDRQVTLSTFRQIIEERIIDDNCDIIGIPWGLVMYYPDKYSQSKIGNLIWQKGNELRRWVIPDEPYELYCARKQLEELSNKKTAILKRSESNKSIYCYGVDSFIKKEGPILIDTKELYDSLIKAKNRNFDKTKMVYKDNAVAYVLKDAKDMAEDENNRNREIERIENDISFALKNNEETRKIIDQLNKKISAAESNLKKIGESWETSLKILSGLKQIFIAT